MALDNATSIVEKLRGWAEPPKDGDGNVLYNVGYEAADEITQLRGLVDKYKALEKHNGDDQLRPAHNEWRRFDGAEEWLAGRVLWAWTPVWPEPRLITADQGDEVEWFIECGPKLEEHDEGYPTHCCDPLPPTLPADCALKVVETK